MLPRVQIRIIRIKDRVKGLGLPFGLGVMVSVDIRLSNSAIISHIVLESVI